jgi:hypothetical protein
LIDIPQEEEMRAANGNHFSDTDYIHYILKQSPIGPDLLGALVRFFHPEFEQIEGKFLLIPTNAPEKYREYRRQGQSPSEAQYWANLTEISGVFEDFNDEQVTNLADAIAQLWQAALMEKSSDFSQHAYKIENEPDGEIFVTISDVPR